MKLNVFFFFLELNSPQPDVVNVTPKPVTSVLKTPMYKMLNKSTDGAFSINECYEYMMSLENELNSVLKTKPSMKGMTNIGTNFS